MHAGMPGSAVIVLLSTSSIPAWHSLQFVLMAGCWPWLNRGSVRLIDNLPADFTFLWQIAQSEESLLFIWSPWHSPAQVFMIGMDIMPMFAPFKTGL